MLRRFWSERLRKFCCKCSARRGLLECLQPVPDPRRRLGRRHPLSAVLAAVVCATLCGFRGIRPVVHWPELHGVGMWHLLGFRRKLPVRQSFADVLAEIDPDRKVMACVRVLSSAKSLHNPQGTDNGDRTSKKPSPSYDDGLV